MAITKVTRNLLNTGVVNNTDGGIIVSTDGYGRALLLPADQNGAPEDNLHYIGSATHRWRDIYLSGAAYLGGTASANALDDYEEGTFTPTIKDGSGNAYTGLYAARNGRYTKIGRMVNLTFEMYVGASLTSGGLSGSAEVQIGNLPFTSNSANFSGGIVSNGTGINYTGDTCYLRISRSVTYISLRSLVADTGSCERAVTVTQLDNSNRLVYGTISYEAA